MTFSVGPYSSSRIHMHALNRMHCTRLFPSRRLWQASRDLPETDFAACFTARRISRKESGSVGRTHVRRAQSPGSQTQCLKRLLPKEGNSHLLCFPRPCLRVQCVSLHNQRTATHYNEKEMAIKEDTVAEVAEHTLQALGLGVGGGLNIHHVWKYASASHMSTLTIL